MSTQRSIALNLLLLQAALCLVLTVLLGVEHESFAILALLAAFMAVAGLLLARRELESLASDRQGRSAGAPGAPAELATIRAREHELESLERLASGVARNFNNLLTVIGGSVSLAERAISRGARPTAELEDAHEAVVRASQLTKRLSAFARSHPSLKRDLELNELLRRLEPTLRRLLRDGTKLSVEPGADALPVRADPSQLHQVLIELVENARDATGPGGEIQITSHRRAEQAWVEVRDDGAGMSQEVQRHLFEPFFTTKPPGQGTGLGLASCHGILQKHDGVLEVESELDRGTLVRVLLPLTSPTDPAHTTRVPDGQSRPRVLVAEDEPQVRAVAVRTLTAAGFEVLEACNGARGLALFEAEQVPIDVLVTDVVMPELSGPELARAVRKLDPSVGLVLMSGYPEGMEGSAPNELAGAEFLAKPFLPQDLLRVVRQRVEARRARPG